MCKLVNVIKYISVPTELCTEYSYGSNAGGKKCQENFIEEAVSMKPEGDVHQDETKGPADRKQHRHRCKGGKGLGF